MTPEEKQIRQKLKDDFKHYAAKCLKIRTKSGKIEPFLLNKAQLHIHEKLEQQLALTGKVRAIILKGRQQGCSSLVGGRFYHKVTHSFGAQAFILTHALDATQNLYKMAQRFYAHTPELVQPSVSTSNAKELIFGDLDSGYKLGTAENKSVGRSATLQLLHGCLAEGTKIYNPLNGSIKNIELFNVGDKILTHNKNIADISYISTQNKDCLSVIFRTLTAFPLIATPEHRFYTKNGWKELKELAVSDCIGFPVKKIIKSHDYFNIPEPIPRRHGGGRQFVCPNSIKIDYELGKVVGLYLSDGHIKLQYKEPRRPSLLCFAVHRNEVERTIAWLLPFSNYFSSIKIKNRENSLTSEVNVYGNRFVCLLYELCGRTTNKHYPLNWSELGEDFCRGMLHGYIAGDGGSYLNARQITATSICSSLAITTRDITASLGYGWASIQYKCSAIRTGRNEKEAFIYRLCGNGATKLALELGKPTPIPTRKKVTSLKNHAPTTTEISDGYAWLRIKSIENVGIKKVYDFEVNHQDHSYCTIHGASHNSECAFWNNAADHAKGIMQAVPNAPGTEIILESTANGVGNYFHQQWLAAEAGLSDFIAIFIPWFWQDEYRVTAEDNFTLTTSEEELQKAYLLSNEQIAWRRAKIAELAVNGQDGEKAFRQEYPCTPHEAFILTGEDSFISTDAVTKARHTTAEPYGKLVVGVDPARFGDDRTSIIRRQGRVAYNLQSYTKKDTMEVVGLVNQIIIDEKPAKVMVDVGGLGAGIVDRLYELGHRDVVVAVNAGSSPLDGRKYADKRAEMWGLCKEWLSDEPVQIPDSNSLQADLCGVKYKVDSVSRLRIEAKQDMKKRGIRSSDEADALCLTFALPPGALETQAKTGEIASKVMQKQKTLRTTRKFYNEQQL